MYTSAAASIAAATTATIVRRRWEERKGRSGARWETGNASSNEMLPSAVGCDDEEVVEHEPRNRSPCLHRNNTRTFSPSVNSLR
jgi:hypothetical protein